MRLSTISGMLLAGLLLVFAIPAHAQFETEWERTSREDAAEPMPAWFGDATERAIAYGVVGGVERLYVPSRSDGEFTIRVIDPETGADLDDVVISTEGISGGAVPFNFISVSDDGKIFVGNLTTDTDDSAFKVYMWEDEEADPVVVVEYGTDHGEDPGHRLGDHLDVSGSVSDGTAVIYAATSNVHNVMRWAMEAGPVNGEYVFEEDPREFLGLAGITPWGSPGWALGVGPGADAGFLASGRSSTFSRRYTSEGATLGYIEWPAGTFNQNVASAEHVRVGGAMYLATYQPTQRRGALVNVNTEAPGGHWTQRFNSLYGGLPSLGESLQNSYGDITTRVNEDGTVTLFVLGTDNGIGAYTTEESLTQPYTVAQARREAPGTEVTVEVVVGRSKGAFTYAQDNTAGITIRQTTTAFRDSVDAGVIVPGTRLSVTGEISEFRGLFQINDGDITEWEVLEHGDAPTPVVITLANIVDNGEQYEGRLVRIDDLEADDAGATFAAGTSYDVTDGTIDGTVELRIPNASDTELVGERVPTRAFSFVGAVGQFTFDEPAVSGYQLMAINADDVFVPAVALDDPVWIVNAGEVPFFANDNNVRGGTYNPASDHVLVPSRTGGVNVFVMHAASGVTLGSLDMTDVVGGNPFAINEVAVTEDGQIFGANLDTGGAAMRIYRWANEDAAPEVIFDGPLDGGRYGDVLAVGGSGDDVRVYIAGGGNNNIAKLTWDGEALGAPEYINVGSQRARMGIAEVPGQDSLWINHPGDPLAKISNEAGTVDMDAAREVGPDVLPSDVGDIAYFTLDGREYVMTGPQYQADHAFLIVDVTEPGDEFIAYRTMALGENPNGNGVGFAAFDSKRGNIIVGATNNAIAAFSISDYEDNTAPTLAEITAPGDGAEVRVEGDPEGEFSAAWEESTDDEDDTVYYRWQLSSGDDFSSTLVDTLVGTATSFSMDFATLATVLDSAGVAAETSLEAYHRVIASDGEFDVEGAASAVTFFRGRLTNVDDGMHLPREFALDGNYPNPFNPSTNIRFDLPEAADVHIDVFDILGRRVMTVPSQSLQAGAGLTIQVDGSQLASGTYLYRVVAEMASETRMETGKMLLIK